MSAIPMPFMNAKGETETIEYTPDYVQAEETLSAGQQEALDAAIAAARKGGQFIFITGNAGTGKSTILKRLRRAVQCIVCAPTGLAAINVRGETIHRFFGFNTGPKRRGNARRLRERQVEVLDKAKAIVIDEISMVRADILDAINWSLQKTYNSTEPFAGFTVIVFGDMWQLEPVVNEKKEEEAKMFLGPDREYPSPFWFDAHCLTMGGRTMQFEEAVQVQTYNLTEVFRQKGDDEFIDALNDIRVGQTRSLATFNSRRVAKPADVKSISLTYTNKVADSTNIREMDKIAGEPESYKAEVEGEFDEKDYPAPGELQIKVGARVMVTKNGIGDDGGFVANGDMGEVVDTGAEWVKVWLDSGRLITVSAAEWKNTQHVTKVETDEILEEEVGKFRQLPLKLAWAITVHKSQGQTLASAVLTLECNAFCHGLLYVGLSRVRTREGLFLQRALTPKDIVIHPRIAEVFGSDITDRKPVLDASLF